MDEKILKWTARVFVPLTVVVCVLLFNFPGMEQFLAARRQRQRAEARQEALRQEEKETVMTAQIEALMEQRTREKETENEQVRVTEKPERYSGVISEAEGERHDINLQLPEGTNIGEVEVENDYVDRAIRVSFPSTVRDYFALHRVWGSSEGVASMSYYLKGGRGILELITDKVYLVSHRTIRGQVGLDLTEPREKYDKLVVVDAGHGGIKTGAEREGVEEKSINLSIVKALKKYSEAQKGSKIGIFYTRLTDEDVPLEKRAGLANELKADLFISVHNNSTTSLSADQVLEGTQVLYSESDRGNHTSKRLAQICLEQVTDALHSRNLGLLPGDDIYIIRNSKAPVALVEVGFITNRSEREKLLTENYQTKVAKGLYQAMEEAFQEGY